MNIMLFSFDLSLIDETSESFSRMQSYATSCGTLVILILSGDGARAERHHTNLHIIAIGGVRIGRLFFALRKSRALVQKYGVQLVSSQDPFFAGLLAWWIAKKYKLAFELQLHGDFYGSDYWHAQGLLWRLRLWIGKKILPRSHHVRVVSKRIARSLEIFGVVASKISVIPVATSVRMQEIGDGSLQSRFSGKTVFLCVARLTREKHVDLFARVIPYVLPRVPNAVFVVVGDGPERAECLAVAKSMGEAESFYMEGSMSHEKLDQYYRSARAVVIPSYTEGYGRVAIEALSHGVPVVMTDVGLAGDVVRHEYNGLIVPVDDDGLLAEAMIRITTDFVLYEQLKVHAIETCAVAPSAEALQKQVAQIWKRCIDFNASP